MKIKTQKTVTVETEHEVNLPMYVVSGSGIHLYKVISETEILGICNYKGHYRIEETGINCVLMEGWKKTTKKNFDAEYAKVLKALKL